MYQHFPIEGSKFRSKITVKNSQDCDAILLLNHSCTLLFAFANYNFLKNACLSLTKMELSACWKKSYGLCNRLPTHWLFFTSKISVNFFGRGNAGSGSDRCGNGCCLQIYRFHIPNAHIPCSLAYYDRTTRSFRPLHYQSFAHHRARIL